MLLSRTFRRDGEDGRRTAQRSDEDERTEKTFLDRLVPRIVRVKSEVSVVLDLEAHGLFHSSERGQ